MSMRGYYDQVALEERDREAILQEVKAGLTEYHRHALRIAMFWEGKWIAIDDERDPLPEAVAHPVTGVLTVMGRDIRADLNGVDRE